MARSNPEGERPTGYTQGLGAEICRRLAGGAPLGRILRHPGMPARETVRRWQREQPAFAAAYALAREDLLEALADDALETAAASAAEDAASRKTWIDTVKWYVGRLAPRGEAAESADGQPSIGDAIEAGRARVLRLRGEGDDGSTA